MVIHVDIKRGMISCVDTRNPASKIAKLHCAASDIWVGLTFKLDYTSQPLKSMFYIIWIWVVWMKFGHCYCHMTYQRESNSHSLHAVHKSGKLSIGCTLQNLGGWSRSSRYFSPNVFPILWIWTYYSFFHIYIGEVFRMQHWSFQKGFNITDWWWWGTNRCIAFVEDRAG